MHFVFLFKNNKEVKSEDINETAEIVLPNACGIVINSPNIGDEVGNTFTVYATVDNTNRVDLGCGWTVFEGQAGLVRVYDESGFSVGSALLTTKGEWMTSGPVDFQAEIQIDIQPKNENLIMLIQEDDPADFGDASVIEIPLIYKK